MMTIFNSNFREQRRRACFNYLTVLVLTVNVFVLLSSSSSSCHGVNAFATQSMRNDVHNTPPVKSPTDGRSMRRADIFPISSSALSLSSRHTSTSFDRKDNNNNNIVVRKASLVFDDSTFQSPSIRSRVKDFFLTQRQKYRNRRNIPAVVEVNDIDVLQYMLQKEQSSYIALMFHAPFCKACQASFPMYKKIAKKYNKLRQKQTKKQQKYSGNFPDIIPSIKFLSVSVTQENSQLLQEIFGVSKFPLAHIYHPEKGLIDERPMLKKLMKGFEERIQAVSTKI